MFTARYAPSPYIKQTRLVFKGLISALDCGKWSTSRPRRFTAWKNYRYQMNRRLSGLQWISSNKYLLTS